jgi:hypothetical protein
MNVGNPLFYSNFVGLAAVRTDLLRTPRWHDNRHTFTTDLAESGEASDETIRDIAGHVSKQMLKALLLNSNGSETPCGGGCGANAPQCPTQLSRTPT